MFTSQNNSQYFSNQMIQLFSGKRVKATFINSCYCESRYGNCSELPLYFTVMSLFLNEGSKETAMLTNESFKAAVGALGIKD